MIFWDVIYQGKVRSDLSLSHQYATDGRTGKYSWPRIRDGSAPHLSARCGSVCRCHISYKANKNICPSGLSDVVPGVLLPLIFMFRNVMPFITVKGLKHFLNVSFKFSLSKLTVRARRLGVPFPMLSRRTFPFRGAESLRHAFIRAVLGMTHPDHFSLYSSIVLCAFLFIDAYLS